MGLPLENEFNPDPSKQAQEVIFGRKTKKEYHPPLAFNSNNVRKLIHKSI